MGDKNSIFQSLDIKKYIKVPEDIEEIYQKEFEQEIKLQHQKNYSKKEESFLDKAINKVKNVFDKFNIKDKNQQNDKDNKDNKKSSNIKKDLNKEKNVDKGKNTLKKQYPYAFKKPALFPLTPYKHNKKHFELCKNTVKAVNNKLAKNPKFAKHKDFLEKTEKLYDKLPKIEKPKNSLRAMIFISPITIIPTKIVNFFKKTSLKNELKKPPVNEAKKHGISETSSPEGYKNNSKSKDNDPEVAINKGKGRGIR